MKINKVLLLTVAFVTLTLQACGNSNSIDSGDGQNEYSENSRKGKSRRSKKKIKKWPHRGAIVRRTTPRSTPAFFQFNGPVGKGPFDPTYKPQSRSKRRHLTKESAGALLYTVKNGTTYVLIGKERQNHFWNFMRGSVDVGDSYVQGAAAEINQETGGIYEVTENVLLSESYDVYHSPKANNYACTFFVKVDYVPADKILHAALTHPDAHFREMIDYEWIELTHLQNALRSKTDKFKATTILGASKSFYFYKYSFNILDQADSNNILNNLD